MAARGQQRVGCAHGHPVARLGREPQLFSGHIEPHLPALPAGQVDALEVDQHAVWRGGAGHSRRVCRRHVVELDDLRAAPRARVAQRDRVAVAEPRHVDAEVRRAHPRGRLELPLQRGPVDVGVKGTLVGTAVDGEVESFELWPMERVIDTLCANGDMDFKPNVALVIIDFLLRRGFVAPEEDGYLDLLMAVRQGDCS